MEDVKVKTRTGAMRESECFAVLELLLTPCPVTLLSAAIIFAITTMEFVDYRTVNMDTSIAVDKSRSEKLTVRLNVTFPRVPCYRESPYALRQSLRLIITRSTKSGRHGH